MPTPYSAGTMLIVTWPIGAAGHVVQSTGKLDILNKESMEAFPGWEVANEGEWIQSIHYGNREERWHPFRWLRPFDDPDYREEWLGERQALENQIEQMWEEYERGTT
jgi:hypothetical protein